MPAPRELPIYELEDRVLAAVKGPGRLIVSGMAQPLRAGQALAASRTKSSGVTAFTGERS